MRSCKYRGKRIDKDEWAYGNVLYDEENNEVYIAEYFEDKMAYFRKVIPETVGQFSEAIAGNDDEVYEHDIIHILIFGREVKAFVEWSDDFNCLFARVIRKNGAGIMLESKNIVEVIGNIHENPELLEVEE